MTIDRHQSGIVAELFLRTGDKGHVGGLNRNGAPSGCLLNEMVYFSV